MINELQNTSLSLRISREMYAMEIFGYEAYISEPDKKGVLDDEKMEYRISQKICA